MLHFEANARRERRDARYVKQKRARSSSGTKKGFKKHLFKVSWMRGDTKHGRIAVRHVKKIRKDKDVGATANRILLHRYSCYTHAQARSHFRLAAQGISISGLTQQARSSSAQQQQRQSPAGGMSGAPTEKQLFDQSVAVGWG